MASGGSTGWKPAPGQVALIELTDGADECLTGVVMDNGEGPVVIDLGSSPGPPASKAEVVASFFTPDALYRVKATASRRDEQVAVLDLTVHEVERVQRRATPRARIEVPVALTAFDGPGEFATVRGETIDLGPGGCRVRTRKAFPPGRDPTLSIQLPDGETLVLLAQVLQQQAESGHFDYRLAFMDVEDNDRKRLEELAAD